MKFRVVCSLGLVRRGRVPKFKARLEMAAAHLSSLNLGASEGTRVVGRFVDCRWAVELVLRDPVGGGRGVCGLFVATVN